MMTKKQLKKKLQSMGVNLSKCDSDLRSRIEGLLKIHPSPLEYQGSLYDVQYKVNWLMGHDQKFRSKVLNMIKFIKA